MTTKPNLLHVYSLVFSTFLSLVSIDTALAGTQTFKEPTLKSTDGSIYRVDRCVNSKRFPDRCSNAATEEAANKFCEVKGYKYAAAYNWHTRPEQNAWIWKEGTEPPHKMYLRTFRIIKGTGMLHDVVCRD
ncbi:hypothetical protein [Acaryochloris sp. CCMEE 5410]|uniref:hypothetical protein n=1 Tax=Acaryochloris sp. CCMEE 5410 TaxID=310037 RepID=UPI000248515C|nr:hypothetical protein [Acaryochloris sp. CCMEE 5410]KAI9130139.1 hypothetical protein ON05_031420 [Acaryochloris sp. CCMEE 5410]